LCHSVLDVVHNGCELYYASYECVADESLKLNLIDELWNSYIKSLKLSSLEVSSRIYYVRRRSGDVVAIAFACDVRVSSRGGR
jgi:hypothetical protein